MDFRIGAMLAGAGAVVLLAFTTLVPSDSFCATCDCPAWMCESEEGARARERKKAWALRRGLPPRLAALFDRIPPCIYCVETMPDWPYIEWEYDADGYEAEYGRPPPYTRRGFGWNRDTEQRVREDMKKGIVKKFTIHLGGVPCRCCTPLDENGNDISDEKYYSTQPGYDEDFQVHPDAGFLFTDPGQLGADPPDLTQLGERYRRPDELDFPELRLPDPVRVVQPLCPDCWPIADEYNEIGRKINELGRLRARKQRDRYLVNQVINHIWLQMQGVGDLAYTEETQKQYDDLLSELGDRQADRGRLIREIEDITKQLTESHEQLAEIMARLAECEENCKRAVEEGKVLIGDDGQRSLYVPAGLRPMTGACQPCAGLEREYNAKVGNLNGIRQEMLELATRYLNERDARLEILDAYEQLIKPFSDALAKAEGLRGQLDECLKRCEGDDDQTGMGLDANPFDGGLGPAADDALMGGMGDDTLTGAIGQACDRFLSVPAETIACSVHTFKKPDLGQGSSNPDVTFGETTAVPESASGGFDTEVFIRNPDDNNLRQGCGDLTPQILLNFNFPPVPKQEFRIVPIACNQIADGHQERRVVLRSGPEKYDVDTSERRRADYFREEDKRFRKTGKDTLHLDIRNLATDTVATGAGEGLSCPPPAKKDDGITFGDVDLGAVPEDVAKVATSAREVYAAEHTGDKIKAAVEANSGVKKVLADAGVDIDGYSRKTAAAETGVFIAEKTVGVMSGESLTTADGKKAADLVAELTGNDSVKKVAEGFDVAVKLEELALKQQQGINIETSDITELVDKLDTLRGDRFEALGEVLGGIKKNSERIEKAEEVIEQLGKAADFLDLAREGMSDPEKAFEAFGDYLEMLSSIAGKVPGMGEFVKKYAEAVKLMRKDVATIAEAVRRTNEAIRQADEAIGGYDYDKLLRDVGRFEEELEEGGDGGTQYTADQKNLWLKTADARYAMDEAEREVRRLEDCILDCLARMKALKNVWNDLNDEYKSLPSQEQLKKELQQAAFKSVYLDRYRAATAAGQRWEPSAQDLANMGETSAVKVLEEFREVPGERSGFTGVKASKAINEARRRLGFRKWARERALEMREEYQRLKKKLEDCEKRLPIAKRDYWQAVRDFVAEHSYWSAFIQYQKYSMADAQKARADALAILDQQIIAMGFGLTDGIVEIITITVCEEDAVMYTTGQ